MNKRYGIAISYTTGSKKECVFETKYKFLFNIMFKLYRKFYKNKMFIWSREI